MIDVAIIDDGVADDFLHSPIMHYVVRNNSVEIAHVMTDNESHGSKCAYIIEHQNTDIVFHDIKILNSFQKGTVNDLLVALNWCLLNKIAVINLSIGTIAYEHYYSFDSICEELRKCGCVVMAAFNNNGEFTLPAALPSVIGVKQFTLKSFFDDNFVDAYAFGQKVFLLGKKLIHCEPCNSFACATVTAAYISYLNRRRKSYNVVSKKEMRYFWFDNLEDAYLYPEETSMDTNISAVNLAMHSTILVQKAQHAKEFIHFLFNNRENVESVIWCGKIPFFLKIVCIFFRIRIWDESVYAQKNIDMAFMSSKSPPIICVRGNNIDAEKIAITLRSYFFQNGYSCVCFSTYRTSYLRGCLFMPCNERNYELVNRIYHPSVIVVINDYKSNVSPDITIQIRGANEFLLCFDVHQEILSSVYDLYSKILTILSNDR